MIKYFSYLLLIIASIGFSRCAQQTSLGGGEKDRTPPQIDTNKTVIPANGTVNFSADRIIIPFNEYVQLKDKDKQILITPFLETRPDIYVKGKKVIIDFNSALENNTTYIINFGKSIVDLTEGNEMVNYKYVFSTGSYIDSLKHTSVIYDAFNKTPVEGAYVMLYKNQEDSVLLKEKPNYFGVTSSQGVCTIENIANGNYKIVSFLEENSNYLWESKTEMIGFTERRFEAAKDTVIDTLVVFKNQPEKLAIEEAMISTSGKGWISFNQPLSVSFDPNVDSLVKQFTQSGSTFINTSRDTLHFFVSPELKTGKKHPMGIEYLPPRKVLVPLTTDSSLSFKTNAVSGLKPGTDLDFVFSQPIIDTDASKVELRLNDKEIPYELVQTGAQRITIEAEWEIGESYEITLFPGIIESYKGLKNDTIKAYFEILEENDFGLLSTSIKVPEGDYIVQLLSEGKIKSYDIVKGGEFSRTYSQLYPGTYYLRLIFDTNGNGVWDTGDYFKHLQPEQVEYYSDPIQIKKGWDMDIQWEIKH